MSRLRQIRLLLYVVVGLASLPALFAQTSEEEVRARDTASRLANLQMKWGPSMNSQGVEIRFKQVSERTEEGHRAILYRLFGAGFPKNTKFEVEETSLDLQVTPVLDGVTLDDSGQAICLGTPDTCGDATKPNNPINFVVVAGKGEPKRFSFISEDGAIKAFAYVIPFPITGKDASCTVEVILLSENADAVLIHGTGFGPSTMVHRVASSESEKQEANIQPDENGEFYDVEFPSVKGKTEGTATTVFHSNECSPSVSYSWGEGSYQLQ